MIQKLNTLSYPYATPKTLHGKDKVVLSYASGLWCGTNHFVRYSPLLETSYSERNYHHAHFQMDHAEEWIRLLHLTGKTATTDNDDGFLKYSTFGIFTLLELMSGFSNDDSDGNQNYVQSSVYWNNHFFLATKIDQSFLLNHTINCCQNLKAILKERSSSIVPNIIDLSADDDNVSPQLVMACHKRTIEADGDCMVNASVNSIYGPISDSTVVIWEKIQYLIDKYVNTAIHPCDGLTMMCHLKDYLDSNDIICRGVTLNVDSEKIIIHPRAESSVDWSPQSLRLTVDNYRDLLGSRVNCYPIGDITLNLIATVLDMPIITTLASKDMYTNVILPDGTTVSKITIEEDHMFDVDFRSALISYYRPYIIQCSLEEKERFTWRPVSEPLSTFAVILNHNAHFESVDVVDKSTNVFDLIVAKVIPVGDKRNVPSTDMDISDLSDDDGFLSDKTVPKNNDSSVPKKRNWTQLGGVGSYYIEPSGDDDGTHLQISDPKSTVPTIDGPGKDDIVCKAGFKLCIDENDDLVGKHFYTLNGVAPVQGRILQRHIHIKSNKLFYAVSYEHSPTVDIVQKKEMLEMLKNTSNASVTEIYVKFDQKIPFFNLTCF